MRYAGVLLDVRHSRARLGINSGRLASLSHGANYRYDANGVLTNLWSGTSGGATNFYQYDQLGRLTNVVSPNGAAGYGFDVVGNLQSVY